jgi:hypothetical protein
MRLRAHSFTLHIIVADSALLRAEVRRPSRLVNGTGVTMR